MSAIQSLEQGPSPSPATHRSGPVTGAGPSPERLSPTARRNTRRNTRRNYRDLNTRHCRSKVRCPATACARGDLPPTKTSPDCSTSPGLTPPRRPRATSLKAHAVRSRESTANTVGPFAEIHQLRPLLDGGAKSFQCPWRRATKGQRAEKRSGHEEPRPSGLPARRTTGIPPSLVGSSVPTR